MTLPAPSIRPRATGAGRRAHRTLHVLESESPAFLARLRSGDREAFGQVVRDYQDRIYYTALRIVKNPEEAQDVRQEALLLAFEKIASFEGRSKLSSWLHVIVSHAALARVRRRRHREVPFEEDLPGMVAGAGPSGSRDGLSWLLFEELEERLDRAVAELPEPYRQVFVLRERDGWTIEQIAKALSIRAGAVKTRLHRARHMLRHEFPDYGNSHLRARNTRAK